MAANGNAAQQASLPNLATIERDGREIPVLVEERGAIPVGAIDARFRDADLLAVIRSQSYASLAEKLADVPDSTVIALDGLRFVAPYRHPRMIWGIGLNYVGHASDLSEQVPEEPASFMKGDHTVIGPGEEIPIPDQSERTTSEAELGIIIGKECRNVSEEDALDYVLGVVPVLDQTAEDILAKNPRFLTRSKNFPGFFGFGPQIVPLSSALASVGGDISAVEVSTVVGEETRTNTVSRMRYSPAHLISFHSHVMPLMPGDILSPGTPGAIHIRPGDTATARIPGVGELSLPVIAQV